MSAAVARTLRWPTTPSDRQRMALWTSAEIAAATGGQASGSFQVSGVEMDSRDVRAGDLFVALKGEAMDGHRFLDKAFANGAVAAIVDRPIPQPHVLVDDTSSALEMLGKAARARVSKHTSIIGVTGSVGKTGVKEAIFAALERNARGAAHRSIRSYNNHVGVPLSLARMPGRSRHGVFEMGMNHAGEIAGLTALVRPRVAVVTTIAPAHIENLGSEEAIADAKAEIFGGLEKGGTAVIPADSPHFERLRKAALACKAKVISFGRAAHADMRLLDAIPTANGGSLVTAAMGPHRLCFNVAEPGEHWISNALCVMAAVHAAGGDMGAAGLALAQMGGLKGRGQRPRVGVPGGHALLIDESYNANTASMTAALSVFAAQVAPGGRKMVVLGDMLELGPRSGELHASLAEAVRASGAERVYLVGHEMSALASALGEGQVAAHAGTAREMAEIVRNDLAYGDAVMVKGSNGVGLAGLIETIRGQFGNN